MLFKFLWFQNFNFTNHVFKLLFLNNIFIQEFYIPEKSSSKASCSFLYSEGFKETTSFFSSFSLAIKHFIAFPVDSSSILPSSYSLSLEVGSLPLHVSSLRIISSSILGFSSLKVASSLSHISLADLQADILSYSFTSSKQQRIFSALELICTFFQSALE